jgi:hypothetical protein
VVCEFPLFQAAKAAHIGFEARANHSQRDSENQQATALTGTTQQNKDFSREGCDTHGGLFGDFALDQNRGSSLW